MTTSNSEQSPEPIELREELTQPKQSLSKVLGRFSMGSLRTSVSKPDFKRRVKIHGEVLVVSRGARLRPVADFLHVAEKARAIRAARQNQSQE